MDEVKRRFDAMHKLDPLPTIDKPLRSIDLHKSVPKWYADLVEPLTLGECFDLVKMAYESEDYPLVELMCARISLFMKGKTPGEIHSTFNL